MPEEISDTSNIEEPTFPEEPEEIQKPYESG